jgi:RNA polymerase sigma factor for flagellar operon FliA
MQRTQQDESECPTHVERSGARNEPERSALVLKYAPIVKLLANRMAMRLPPNVSVDDLVSAGRVGLLDAIEKFDPRRDVQLKTYAEFRIRGAILDELRGMDWLPRSVRRMVRQMEEATKKVEQRLSRPADVAEVAKEMGVDLDMYHAMLDHTQNTEVLSLDECVENRSDDSTSKRSYQALISGEDNPLNHVITRELTGIMAQEIKSLSEKEQLVLSLYYYEGLTLREIGEVIGLTESRICQIHTQAITTLRSRFKSYLEP